MANPKTLTQRDAFDGTTPCHTMGPINLDYIDDNSPPNPNLLVHRVFKEDYKKEFYISVPPFVQDNNALFSTFILGWTTTYPPRFPPPLLPRPPDIMLLDPRRVPHVSQMQQLIANNMMNYEWMFITSNLRQIIFPVIVRGRNQLPLLINNNGQWTGAIDTAYGYGQYLALVPKRRYFPIGVSVRFNNVVTNLQRMNATLYYYNYKSPKTATQHPRRTCIFINRILDPINDPDDYPVFGMYAGGGLSNINTVYQYQEKIRLCWDQQVDPMDVMDEVNVAQTRRNSFRTQISYDWRTLRVGYYCGRNAQLVVSEAFEHIEGIRGENNQLNSLLRESTFIVADGTHFYAKSQSSWKNQIRNMNMYVPLLPMIAVVTEGVSHIRVIQNRNLVHSREVFYNLENRCSQPILIDWINFEKDLSPSVAIDRSYVELQSYQFKPIMRREDFFDYLYFRDIRLYENPNFPHYRNDIVMTLADSISFNVRGHSNTLWNCYALLLHTHYCYLGTFGLSSDIETGDLTDPYLRTSNRIPQLFLQNQYPLNELDANQVIRLNELLHWYTMVFEPQLRESYFYKTCIRKLKYIYQLRNPTVNALLRDGKIRSVWRQRSVEVNQYQIPQYIPPMIPGNPPYQGRWFRRYQQRYWQIVKRRDFQDYVLFQLPSDQVILAMADFPIPRYDIVTDPYGQQIYRDCVRMDQIWDVYVLIYSNDLDNWESLFYFVGTVSYSYPVEYQIFTTAQGIFRVIDLNNTAFHRESHMTGIQMDLNEIDSIWFPPTEFPLNLLNNGINQINNIWENGHMDHQMMTWAQHLLMRPTLENPSFWDYFRTASIKYPSGVSWYGQYRSWQWIFNLLRNPI